jgi:DNA ligase-associated metallophosphoesterase
VVLSLGTGGVHLIPDGAVWLPVERVLVVSDLHLEKGSHYAARGQMLPPYDSHSTLARVEALVERLAPDVLVSLGDSFHDAYAGERLAPDVRARLEVLGHGRNFLWVEGNHDPELPAGLPGERLPAVTFGGITWRHIPSDMPETPEAAGHLHPCARVAGRTGSVRRRCFVADGKRLILPAMGALAGGLNVCDPGFEPLFQAPPQVFALARHRVIPVAWSSLVPDAHRRRP